ncbi:hypothetical protein LOAG_01679 [Loa loa]|uniref:Uncharacterized protein n=1 Tax=Loa loa TaxID=7209 RepID=A0A1S0U8E6_LOALO|nr:hypothetical protein LOAG_01679 [Loa loa]EFO26808.1 hypothetical protein LOAG_01679 [Loa loa]
MCQNGASVEFLAQMKNNLANQILLEKVREEKSNDLQKISNKIIEKLPDYPKFEMEEYGIRHRLVDYPFVATHAAHLLIQIKHHLNLKLNQSFAITVAKKKINSHEIAMT